MRIQCDVAKKINEYVNLQNVFRSSCLVSFQALIMRSIVKKKYCNKIIVFDFVKKFAPGIQYRAAVLKLCTTVH